MSNDSFYKWQEDKNAWVCKVCGWFSTRHAEDCIVPNAQQAMDILAEYYAAKKKMDDGLRKIMSTDIVARSEVGRQGRQRERPAAAPNHNDDRSG
jgi:hypothetical protein